MISRLLWVLVAALPVLGVAACGDDDEMDDSSASTSTTVETTATTESDYSTVDAELLTTFHAAYPGMEEVEVSRDGVKLELHFGIGDGSYDSSELAMLAVQNLQKDAPAVLDGVEDVRVHVEGPGGETEEVYPYNEVQAWIEEAGGIAD